MYSIVIDNLLILNTSIVAVFIFNIRG